MDLTDNDPPAEPAALTSSDADETRPLAFTCTRHVGPAHRAFHQLRSLGPPQVMIIPATRRRDLEHHSISGVKRYG
ncbi:MAG TPA: hypothetical protein VIP77_22475 [Jiangellaceae bacterium]